LLKKHAGREPAVWKALVQKYYQQRQPFANHETLDHLNDEDWELFWKTRSRAFVLFYNDDALTPGFKYLNEGSRERVYLSNQLEHWSKVCKRAFGAEAVKWSRTVVPFAAVNCAKEGQSTCLSLTPNSVAETQWPEGFDQVPYPIFKIFGLEKNRTQHLTVKFVFNINSTDPGLLKSYFDAGVSNSEVQQGMFRFLNISGEQAKEIVRLQAAKPLDPSDFVTEQKSRRMRQEARAAHRKKLLL